ncbi:MAG: HD family phosphohydrolase [Akkermansiaceae bacterium]
MGFIDAFKRWRLAKKGMSSGKKRRTSTTGESAVVDSMERSVWMKLLIYPAFAALVCLLAAFYVSDGVLFHGSGMRRSLLCMALCAAVVVLYHTRNTLKVGNGEVVLVFGGVVVHLAMLRAAFYFVEANGWAADYRMVLPLLAFAPMTHSVLLGRYSGTFSALVVSMLGSLMMPIEDMFSFFLISFVAGVTAVALTRRVRRRGSLLRAGFYVGVVTLLMAAAVGQIDMSIVEEDGKISDELLQGVAALSMGLVTGMVVSGLLPLLEATFTVTTDISWLELSDLNHKLLRKLQLEAPGTYHHSMVVASLAESAAEDVGANASMCRVCSYFHDIGKLSKPEYFIENQGENNPHDSLTPTMSAIIIIAHVKDGVDMAIKHKLNPVIIDVIREHHGESLVSYFYHKAREQRADAEEKVKDGIENREDLPEVDAKNFRYPGPIPSTRESAIICLADCVESASRTIKKATPQKIRNKVHELVMARVSEGMLDNSGMTMGEIKVVCESFTSTLRSMMHSRIDYPKGEKGNGSGSANGGNRGSKGGKVTKGNGETAEPDKEKPLAETN